MKKLYLLVFSLIVFVIVGCSPDNKKPTIELSAIQNLANSFGHNISIKNYADAYNLMSPQYKGYHTEKDFTYDIDQWIQTSGIISMTYDSTNSSIEKTPDEASQVGWAYLIFEANFKDAEDEH
ncbi:MAG: hypothetical protein ACRCXK_02425, partial [Wohlfahrtiimonas sp.]